MTFSINTFQQYILAYLLDGATLKWDGECGLATMTYLRDTYSLPGTVIAFLAEKNLIACEDDRWIITPTGKSLVPTS